MPVNPAAEPGICRACGRPHGRRLQARYCLECRPVWTHHRVCPDCGVEHTSRSYARCHACRRKARSVSTYRSIRRNAGLDPDDPRCLLCDVVLDFYGQAVYCDECRVKWQSADSGMPVPPPLPPLPRRDVLPPCEACGGPTFYEDGDNWHRCRQCGREYPPEGYVYEYVVDGWDGVGGRQNYLYERS